ncbi:hypothetical protein BDY21DRAFT_206048 [Lineolata rhizophorae]|uniref:Uncharacterized protein n=1 Tax=Lineolata rhizophorae TaxID=578093 RepID=A0A6A6P3W1_9PEZI|nr:hypothetical protein BDY21DRAFT_206048 [Lineolata rhizophorae]
MWVKSLPSLFLISSSAQDLFCTCSHPNLAGVSAHCWYKLHFSLHCDFSLRAYLDVRDCTAMSVALRGQKNHGYTTDLLMSVSIILLIIILAFIFLLLERSVWRKFRQHSSTRCSFTVGQSQVWYGYRRSESSSAPGSECQTVPQDARLFV